MEIRVTLEGGKKVAAELGGHKVLTDQPVKYGGTDSAPAPYDLFVASIGTCVGFYVQSFCQKRDLDTSGIEIKVQTTRSPGSKITDGFEIDLLFPKTIPANLHGALIKTAEQCAVKKTIACDPEFKVRVKTAE